MNTKKIDEVLDNIKSDTLLEKTKESYLIIATKYAKHNKDWQEVIKDLMGYYSNELREYIKYYYSANNTPYYNKMVLKAKKNINNHDKLLIN